MPVTIGQITSNTAKASFTVTITEEDEEGTEHTREEQVNLTYYPGRITEKTIVLSQGINGVAQDDLDGLLGGFRAFNDEMVRLIKWWDVLENDGTTMFPLEASRLEELPYAFRGQLLSAMVNDTRPEAVEPQMNGAH
jgi:hypothetical protein